MTNQLSKVILAAGPAPVQVTKNVLLVLFIIKLLRLSYRSLVFRGVGGSVRHLLWFISKSFVSTLRALPSPAAGMINAEIEKTLASMEKSLAPPPKAGEPGPYLALPDAPLSHAALRAELERYKAMGSIDYKKGQISGAVYHGGDELSALITEAYGLFSSTNPLHPDVFPGVRKMEAEIVQMVVRMFHGEPDGCGALTSGGTESILMACKAYRELARIERGVTEPEMVVPETIHAAFDKAAHYFGIKIVKIPLGDDFRVRLDLVKRAITKNTIMIAGSAPNFPHGIIDDLQGLSNLAVAHKIPMHVDCCLGSFLMAFIEETGFEVPPFDFRLPGVTSMSVDTHKYGFAPKGSSVIMYHSKAYRKHQYFVEPNWTGGIYASPSIAGSRPGALIAGCWATMMSMGRSGYLDATKKIVGTAREIAQRIRDETPMLEVIGNPLVSVVAFRASRTAPAHLNVLAVNDAMSQRGWNLNALQYPAAVHIACTLLTVGRVDQFMADLKDAVEAVLHHPEQFTSGSAAMYGMAAAVPDRSIVNDIVVGYLDLCLKP
ncbi:hypothetical protein GGF32_006029 [Allomyces javanicus]|nr:hypothetical protein GGF32_006029 [Allomyces javanicus]